MVTQSTDGIRDIAQAVEGEASAITQVTEAIGQISAAVQSNSASSEESAAVSAELFQEVRTLESTTSRILKNMENNLLTYCEGGDSPV